MATGGDNFWKEAAAWLTRIGIIPQDHKANSESEVKVHPFFFLQIIFNLISFSDACNRFTRWRTTLQFA